MMVPWLNRTNYICMLYNCPLLSFALLTPSCCAPKNTSVTISSDFKEVQRYTMASSLIDTISPEDLASYKDAFSSFDRDGDGTITSSELGTVMRSLGRNPTEAELQEILKGVDKDQNGTIELVEFLDLMARNPQTLGTVPQDELWQAFSVFDKDRSGKISLKELEVVMRSLGEHLTADELDIMIKEADLDGDHEISFPEFKKMVTERSMSS